MTPAKVLLRGMFLDGTTPERVVPNIMRLVEAVDAGRYEFVQPDYKEVFSFASAYFKEHGTPPLLANLEHLLTRLPSNVDSVITLADMVTDLASVKLEVFAQFNGILATELEAYRRSKAVTLLTEAGEIVTKGKALKGYGFQQGAKLKGVEDAYRYVVDGYGKLLETLCRPTRSDVWEEGADVVAEHEAAKTAPRGIVTGLPTIDGTFGSVRPGELWTHAAFTGGLKTTLALNVSYNVTMAGGNVLYVTLEMPVEQIRRLGYALHSASPKFGRAGLNYSLIKEGKLPATEEDFLRVVAGDAKSTPGKLIAWSPPVTPTVADIGSEAERLHRDTPISLIVVDHSGLVRANSKDKDSYTRLNTVFVDAKRMALGFAGGTGVPVMLLHQVNREGYRAASKGGELTAVHLSGANEAERSSDFVTTGWVDQEHRERGRVRMSCLKNRDGASFAAFEASVNFPSRRIFEVAADFGADLGDLELDDLLTTLG